MILERGYRYMMYNKLEKMKQSLIDVQDLYRNEMPVTAEMMDSTCSKLDYLAWEIQTLSKQIKSDQISGGGMETEEE